MPDQIPAVPDFPLDPNLIQLLPADHKPPHWRDIRPDLAAELDDRDATISSLRDDLDFQTKAAFDNQAEAARLAAELERVRSILITAAPAADHAHRQLRAIREARAHHCDTNCTDGGCDFDLGAFVDRVDEILNGSAPVPGPRMFG